MNWLAEFCRLPRVYRRLLTSSVLLLGLVRVGLWLLPFQVVRRLLAHTTRVRARAQGRERPSLTQVTRAVTVASRYIPVATCLTQALATQILLSRLGYSASLRIGVTRGDAGDLQAHAWVECQGRVVIGGAQALSRFTPLLSMESDKP